MFRPDQASGYCLTEHYQFIPPPLEKGLRRKPIMPVEEHPILTQRPYRKAPTTARITADSFRRNTLSSSGGKRNREPSSSPCQSDAAVAFPIHYSTSV